MKINMEVGASISLNLGMPHERSLFFPVCAPFGNVGGIPHT